MPFDDCRWLYLFAFDVSGDKMKKITFLFAWLMVSLLTTDLTGQQNRPPRGDTDVPATSNLNDSDAAGTFFGIRSDGLGSYRNGINSVESIIQAIGDWEMDAKLSGTRRVYIDFGDPVVPGDTSAPFSSALVPTRFISKCALLGFKIRDMTFGQTSWCPLATSFDFGGSTYRITMNPNNHIGSEWVQWTCLATTGGRCASWEMMPSVIQADGQRKARGRLIKVGSRRVPDQLLGEFYFAFALNITTP